MDEEKNINMLEVDRFDPEPQNLLRLGGPGSGKINITRLDAEMRKNRNDNVLLFSDRNSLLDKEPIILGPQFGFYNDSPTWLNPLDVYIPASGPRAGLTGVVEATKMACKALEAVFHTFVQEWSPEDVKMMNRACWCVIYPFCLNLLLTGKTSDPEHNPTPEDVIDWIILHEEDENITEDFKDKVARAVAFYNEKIGYHTNVDRTPQMEFLIDSMEWRRIIDTTDIRTVDEHHKVLLVGSITYMYNYMKYCCASIDAPTMIYIDQYAHYLPYLGSNGYLMAVMEEAKNYRCAFTVIDEYFRKGAEYMFSHIDMIELLGMGREDMSWLFKELVPHISKMTGYDENGFREDVGLKGTVFKNGKFLGKSDYLDSVMEGLTKGE